MPETTTTPVPAGTWAIDPAHSSVGFTVRHMMVSKVRGKFTDFAADIVTTEDPLESTVNATVQMASVDTSDNNRDEHLRTNDFFDVEHHPTMTLRSTKIERVRSDYKLHADLTIRGVIRPVVFDLELGGVAKDPWGNTRAGFTATGSINRKDFGLKYNAPLETGGVLIGDKVTIELDVEATLKAD
jgi:polyisoprenoid-binding protein YceI